MYLFFLIFLIFVSIILVCLILLQSGQGLNNTAHFNVSSSIKSFNSIKNGGLITNIISIFAFLFLMISIILCNINDRQIHSDFFWENNKYDISNNIKHSIHKKESKTSHVTTSKN